MKEGNKVTYGVAQFRQAEQFINEHVVLKYNIDFPLWKAFKKIWALLDLEKPLVGGWDSKYSYYWLSNEDIMVSIIHAQRP